MSAGTTKFALWSNNSYLEDAFLGETSLEDIKFLEYRESNSLPYVLILIDLMEDLSNISQKLINFYKHVRENNQKLTVLLLHGENIDTEKNIYFEELLNKISDGKPLHRLVITKDLFQSALITSDTYIEKYILEAISNRKVNISAKGENQYFPITFPDLINSLKKIFFLNATSGKTFWILGDPVTDLEIAYLVKKNLEDTEGQEFEIDSSGENIKNSVDMNSLGNQSRALLNWEPKDDFNLILKDAIKRLGEDRSLLITRLHHVKEQNKYPQAKKIGVLFENIGQFINKIKPKNRNKKTIESGRELIKIFFEYTVAIACLIYLTVSLAFISFTGLSLQALEGSVANLRKGDIAGSVKELNNSTKYLVIGENSYSFVSPIIALIAPDFHLKNYNLFIFLHYSQTSLTNLQQTYNLAEKIYQTIGDTTPKQFYSDSSLALRSNLGQLYENLNQIDLLTKSGKLPKILEEKLNSSNEFKNLNKIEQQVTDLLKTAELIPSMLAGDSAKNIVVLFQNSFEIRPTGGAIDYVLSLVIDNGRIVSRKIYRSDEIDALSAGVVSAPPLVRLYTGIEDWKMRDLNFNPDFPQTSGNLSWFIEKNLKFKPDIILGVTENLFVSLLIENQGILLNGQNITSDTLTSEMSKISPSPLYHKLIDYYLDRIIDHKLTLVSLGRVVASLSQNNQMLFWTADTNIEKVIISQSYSGSIFPHSCIGGLSSTKNCLSETTYFNESNFSLVPLGSKLQRKIRHTVTLEQNSVKHEYRVEYQFNSQVSDINRDLNEVIQIYGPQNSVLNKVVLDDKNISLAGVLNQQDNLLERFQIPLSMSFNQPHTLIIQFTSLVSQPNVLPFSYSLTEYHQTGFTVEDTELVLNYPESAKPSVISAPVTMGPNSLNLVLPAKTTTFGVSLTTSNQ